MTPSIAPLDWGTAQATLPLSTVHVPETAIHTQPVVLSSPFPDATELPVFEFNPDVCTTANLNLRGQPGTQEQIMRVLGPKVFLQQTGFEFQANGYKWVEVQTAEGELGWVADNWLSVSACAGLSPGGQTPTIIVDAYRSGYFYGQQNGNHTHYGVDIYSGSGDPTIYSPFNDRVVAADPCPACLHYGPGDGNAAGRTGDPALNYGYGAMTVVEYPYEELSPAQREELRKDNIELQEGQSLYLMVAHLDPRAPLTESGIHVTQGADVGSIGNSGNSYGAHAHVEAAVQQSGLNRDEQKSLGHFWLHSVLGSAPGSDREDQRQGRRVDPTPLFDLNY